MKNNLFEVVTDRKFVVGEKYASEINRECGISSLGDSLILTNSYINRTEFEVENLLHNDIQLKISHHKNVIDILYRFGDLLWCDTAFTPHLSTIESHNIKEIYVMIFNAADGELLGIRMFRLSDYFSKTLNSYIKEEQGKAFDIAIYKQNCLELYNTYQPEQLAKKSNIYCNVSRDRIQNLLAFFFC